MKYQTCFFLSFVKNEQNSKKIIEKTVDFNLILWYDIYNERGTEAKGWREALVERFPSDVLYKV